MSAIPKEILKKVRAIQIQTSRLVSDTMAGEYHSTFKGRGMEFSEVREYVPGDDIRSIDWNVTARMNKPYVKQYVEERELTVMLVVDVSASLGFSSAQQMKSEIAAELSAVLALSAIRNNDKVGLILFSDRIEKYIAPKKGKSHVLRVIREVLTSRAEGRGTDINAACEFLRSAVRKKAVVFLLSDFMTDGYQKLLRIVARRHDLITINLKDRRERSLPSMGLVHFMDAESGEMVLLDTGDSKTRSALQILHDRRQSEEDRYRRANRIQNININTEDSYVKPLVGFFRNRDKWKR
jgi:uncharacterized protein (DUF58 family)